MDKNGKFLKQNKLKLLLSINTLLWSWWWLQQEHLLWKVSKRKCKLTWISVSSENRTSDRSLWWIYDHLNSGIRNGGLDGPGENIGLVEFDFVLPCRWSEFEKRKKSIEIKLKNSCSL